MYLLPEPTKLPTVIEQSYKWGARKTFVPATNITLVEEGRELADQSHHNYARVDQNNVLESATAASLPRTNAVSASDGGEKFFRCQI
jgi:hypothetical protein